MNPPQHSPGASVANSTRGLTLAMSSTEVGVVGVVTVPGVEAACVALWLGLLMLHLEWVNFRQV